MNFKQSIDKLKKVGEAIGVDAYNEICDVLWKYQMRIKDLEKSRDNWKQKYVELKNGKDMLPLQKKAEV